VVMAHAPKMNEASLLLAHSQAKRLESFQVVSKEVL